MAEQRQFMAMVPDSVLDRLDALRIALGVSRAEVNRQVLDRYLRLLEQQHVRELSRLYLVADARGVPWDHYVQQLAAKYPRGGMPPLEELELAAGLEPPATPTPVTDTDAQR